MTPWFSIRLAVQTPVPKTSSVSYANSSCKLSEDKCAFLETYSIDKPKLFFFKKNLFSYPQLRGFFFLFQTGLAKDSIQV